MEVKEAFALGFIFGAIVTLLLIGTLIESPIGWKAEAIQHGVAHYDEKTGEFQWNDLKEP